MASLKKFNFNGENVGEIAIDDSLWKLDANRQMIKDYLVAMRRNKRQWSANTKGRSEVKHTTKKPYRQKGTGNARQGMLVAPQYKGGGIVFGPKPKFDQHVRINRKERRLAIRHLLGEKWKEENVSVIEDGAFSDALKRPKTKEVASLLRNLGVDAKKVLFIGASPSGAKEVGKYEIFKKSMQNLRKCNFVLASQVNGYDLIVSQKIVIAESALEELKKLFANTSDERVG